MNYRFSRSWHYRKLLKLDWPAKVVAPTHPKKLNTKKVNKIEKSQYNIIIDERDFFFLNLKRENNAEKKAK